jgi:hypothetical protein
MPAKVKPEPAAARHQEPTPLSLLSEWARQGTDTFFATQRILLDLVMRQNVNAMAAVRERLAGARKLPVAALTEMAGEGMSNLIAAERVLLHLAQRENEILVGALQDRAGNSAPASAMTNVLRRSVDTLVEMQMHFLTLAAKQADLWVDAVKSGEPFSGKGLPEVARESMETFVRAQKKFLDVIAEETNNLTEGVTNNHIAGKKTHLAELAREAAEAFLDAQKKVLDVTAQQGDVNVKTAKSIFEALNPFQPAILKEFSKNTVENLVAAEKAILDVLSKAPSAAAHEPVRPPKKGPQRKRAGVKRTAAATA